VSEKSLAPRDGGAAYSSLRDCGSLLSLSRGPILKAISLSLVHLTSLVGTGKGNKTKTSSGQ
jgi:hypothetical protein